MFLRFRKCQKMCFGWLLEIPRRLKSTLFEIFCFTPPAPSGSLHSKNFQKILILAFEANSALSRENEAKIVKITQSDSSGLIEGLNVELLQNFSKYVVVYLFEKK